MFCRKCGFKIPVNSKFCRKCGTPIVTVNQNEKVGDELQKTPSPVETAVPVPSPEQPAAPQEALPQEAVDDSLNAVVETPVSEPEIETELPEKTEPAHKTFLKIMEPIPEVTETPVSEPEIETELPGKTEPAHKTYLKIMEPIPEVAESPVSEPEIKAELPEKAPPASNSLLRNKVSIPENEVETPESRNEISEQPVAEMPQSAAPVVQPQAPVKVSQVTANKAVRPKTKQQKLMPLIIVGSAVVLIALFIIVGSVLKKINSTINLNDYIVVETEGYDGYGSAYARVDWDAIEDKYGSRISYTREAIDKYDDRLDDMSPVDILRKYVNVRLKESSGLSNDMEVKYIWDINEEYSEYIKCSLKFENDVCVISGLSKVGVFDAFADLKVDFSGIEPNGYVNLEYDGFELSRSAFECNRTEGLSNGDVIKITIDERVVDYLVEDFGKVPESLEKEYTVKGLSKYLTKLSEVDAESLSLMKDQANDVMQSNIAKNWGAGEKLSSLTYIGNILLTEKDMDYYGGVYLYLVYRVQVHNTYSNSDDSYDKVNTYYWFIRFENLMVEPDGKLKFDITDYSTPGNRFSIRSGISAGWSEKAWEYNGYETYDDLYKNVVTSNMDSYYHEENVDDKAGSNTAVATPTPSTIDTRDLVAVEIECDGVTSSGYHTQKPGEPDEKRFYPDLTVDGDLATAWNVRGHEVDEDGDGTPEFITTQGVGEYIEFTFTPGTYLKSITICPGFCYSANDSIDRFGKNFCPTSVTVTAGGKSFNIDLTDYAYDVEMAMDGCEFEFPDWILLTDGRLRITINEVRNIHLEQGDDWWDDCCISEIMFYGALPED